MNRRALAFGGALVLAIAIGWVLFVALPRWYRPRPTATATAQQAPHVDAPQPAAARKITATLYFVSDDGFSLVPAQREVPYAEEVAEQARAIVEAQLMPSPPLVSAIPAGTRLRQVFVTEHGDAFVDLSPEVSTNHPGGSLEETLTVNLPAITHVQILVDGKEVDTLAGHVDLRHPLAKSLEWVVHDTH